VILVLQDPLNKPKRLDDGAERTRDRGPKRATAHGFVIGAPAFLAKKGGFALMPKTRKKFSPEIERLRRQISKEYAIRDKTGLAILNTGLQALDLMNRCQRVVDDEGLTVPGDRGGVKAHPLLSVIRDQRAQFLASLKALNLDLEPLKGIGRPGGYDA
jgi:hypothetical protein